MENQSQEVKSQPRRVIRRVRSRSGFMQMAIAAIAFATLGIVAIVAIVAISNKSGCCCCDSGVKESLSAIITKAENLIDKVDKILEDEPESRSSPQKRGNITTGAVSIPEPSSIALISAGFVAMLLMGAKSNA